MIAIKYGLSLKHSAAKNPHTSSMRKNTGKMQLNETLKPSLNFIEETIQSVTADKIIIPELSKQLNVL